MLKQSGQAAAQVDCLCLHVDVSMFLFMLMTDLSSCPVIWSVRVILAFFHHAPDCRGETALVAKIRAGKPATVHSIAFDEGETLLSVQESPVTSHQGCQRLAVLTRSRQEASECPKIIEITTGRCTTILTALSQELSSHLDLMPLVKRLDAEATSLSISLDRHLASFEEAQHSSGRFGPFHHLQVYHWLPGGETLWLEGQGRGQGGSSMQVISANDGEVLHSREIMELKETWED